MLVVVARREREELGRIELPNSDTRTRSVGPRDPPIGRCSPWPAWDPWVYRSTQRIGCHVLFCFCEPEIIRSLCRYWRQAADTYPDLWSNINRIPRPEPMQLFLNRSGARPLEVCGHPLAGTAVPSLELLYISDVHGDSPDSYPADWVPQLFARSIQAPRIQRLCLGRILLVSPPKFDNPTVSTASLSPELGYLRC